jgi:hypothetical protein
MTLRFERRAAVGVLAAALLFGAGWAISETLTMTTYYPSPSGVYRRLVTTAQTLLARDGGSVGIGTTAPQAKLDVAGGVRIGASSLCGAAQAGTNRYNAGLKQMEFCDGASWKRTFGTGQVPVYRCPLIYGMFPAPVWSSCLGQITLEFSTCRYYTTQWNTVYCTSLGKMVLESN